LRQVVIEKLFDSRRAVQADVLRQALDPMKHAKQQRKRNRSRSAILGR
jgi:hypothetical protein